MGTIFVISSRRDLPIYVFWSDLLLVAESVAEYVANLTFALVGVILAPREVFCQ